MELDDRIPASRIEVINQQRKSEGKMKEKRMKKSRKAKEIKIGKRLRHKNWRRNARITTNNRGC